MAPTVELFLDGEWVDITDDVRTDPGIEITFGIQNEAGTADPAQCNLAVSNFDGRYSPKNPAGPWYGHLTRNTPLRVLDDGAARFAGEISEFPSRWNLPGSDVWSPLVASGILRRLGRANQLDSAFLTGMRGVAAAGNLIGYWPMEDLPGAETFANEIAGGAPGTILAGTPVLANADPGPASRPVPTWAGAAGQFFPLPVTTNNWTVGFWLIVPAAGATDNRDVLRIQTSAGTANTWVLRYDDANAGQLVLVIRDDFGDTVLLNTTLAGTTGLNGKAVFIKLEVAQNGANIDWYVQPYGTGFGAGATLNSATVGAPLRLEVNAANQLEEVGIGQLLVGKTSTALFTADLDNALRSYAGETATARATRVAALGGIPMTILAGDLPASRVGPQQDGTLLEILRATEKADVGAILRDSITQVGLVYTTRAYRYSRDPVLELDYAAGHLSPPLEPTDDDANVRNDVTATRAGGSSYRLVRETGPLNAQDYPDGIGPYPYGDTYNIYSDADLPDVAGFVLNRGTVDETRWPRITLDLVKHPDLVAGADLLRPGHRITIANLPTFQGTGSADLQVIGWTERYGPNVREMTLVCEPGNGNADGGGGIWNVLLLDDPTYGRLDENRLGM